MSVIVAAIQAGGSSSGLSDTAHVHVHVHGSDPSTSSLFGLTARLTSGLIPPRDQLAKRASASFQSSRLQLRTAGIRLSLCSAKTSALRSLPAASSQHSQRKRVPHRSAPVRPVVAHHTCFLCARGLRSTQFSASSFQLTGRRSSCWISLQRPSSPPLPWPLDRASCFKQVSLNGPASRFLSFHFLLPRVPSPGCPAHRRRRPPRPGPGPAGAAQLRPGRESPGRGGGCLLAGWLREGCWAKRMSFAQLVSNGLFGMLLLFIVESVYRLRNAWPFSRPAHFPVIRRRLVRK